MKRMKKLVTTRLVLKPFTEKDVKGVFELDSDTLVHKYLGNQPLLDNEEQALEVIQFIQSQYEKNGLGRYATFEKQTDEFIGWTGLKWETGEWSDFPYYDIGYRLIPRYWGKGYATEASVECLRYGFQELDLPAIYGAAENENKASNRILQKCGLKHLGKFEFEGTWHNWFGIKKEDYKSI
jgi:ribosomal-protein-alanine N-acetyltransferase